MHSCQNGKGPTPKGLFVATLIGNGFFKLVEFDFICNWVVQHYGKVFMLHESDSNSDSFIRNFPILVLDLAELDELD